MWDNFIISAFQKRICIRYPKQVLTFYNKDYDEWTDSLMDGRTGALTDEWLD